MVKTQGRTKGVDLGETPRALTYPSETRLQELAECSSDSRELVDSENQKYSQLIEKELVNSPSTSLIESEMAVESNQSMERAKSVSI